MCYFSLKADDSKIMTGTFTHIYSATSSTKVQNGRPSTWPIKLKAYNLHNLTCTFIHVARINPGGETILKITETRKHDKMKPCGK